jgi:F-type H+-transporting ATPase subunit gamma
MAGTKEIKRRIKSVKNTKKITKALELVSASKMKRAIASALASRLYAGYSWEILTSIAKNLENSKHPLFIESEKKEGEKENILVILITSNRGLCGSYDAQIIKKTILLLKSSLSQNSANPKDSNIDFITVGRKGDVAIRRLGKNIIANFNELPDNISLSDILPISKLAMDEYSSPRYDKVMVAYTDFISALTQKANIRQVLPISRDSLKEVIESIGESSDVKRPTDDEKIDYLFEGDFNVLIETLAEKITRMQIFQMFLESNASEQSSRMMAMKNASEASGEMIDDLTLMFNKARQANITREISEISAGMTSVS